jgi:hypothetical protein
LDCFIRCSSSFDGCPRCNPVKLGLKVLNHADVDDHDIVDFPITVYIVQSVVDGHWLAAIDDFSLHPNLIASRTSLLNWIFSPTERTVRP